MTGDEERPPNPLFQAMVDEVRRELESLPPETPDEMRKKWDELAERITAGWPEGLTAEEAIRRGRDRV